MSTQAQIAANRENAQLSTGPTSAEGKAASSRNRMSHGLSYESFTFCLLPWEDAGAYSQLFGEFCSEHRPQTTTEKALVERMVQHHWLRNRAEFFESKCFSEDGSVDEKRLALYMRYRTSHERAFHKCLSELLKLRAEKRKQEIGFESQKRAEADNTRKQEKHEMKKERHKWEILLAEVRVDGEQLRTLNRDMDESERLIALERAKQAA
jgi:hypothetical protein